MGKRLNYLAFLISGVAGILYQILWIRILSLAFGGVTFTTVLIISIFLSGLAAGAYIGGKLVDYIGGKNGRYVFWFYLGVEVLTLIFGIICWGVFTSYIYQTGAERYHIAGVLLFTQTFFMGSTWPAMFKILLLVREETRVIGRVSFLNTLGAAMGAFLGSFLLISNIGFNGSLYIAILLNLLAGLFVLFSSFLFRDTVDFPEKAAKDYQKLLPGSSGVYPVLYLFLALFIAGFAGMSLEILWMRSFGLIIGGSIYSFTLVLTVILLGLAFGGVLAEKAKASASFGKIKTILYWESLFVLMGMWILTKEPNILVYLRSWVINSFLNTQVLNFILVAVVVFIPSLLSGMVLPLGIIALKSNLSKAGKYAGLSYFVNTFGSVLGGILTAFFFLPYFGLKYSILGLGLGLLIYSLSFDLFNKSFKRVFALFIPALLLGLFSFRGWDNLNIATGGYLYGESVLGRNSGFKVLSYKDGRESSVMTIWKDGITMLQINGKVDASNNPLDMGTQVVLGHLPAFLIDEPKKVLVIGMGSGITAGALTKHNKVEKLFISEIEPEVINVARDYFSEENYNVLDNPKTELVIGDGRNFLLETKERFDVITSEPSNPWISGEGNLFTKEFFELGKEKLDDNGIFFQWLHMYNLRPDEIKSIIKTFSEVFPHIEIWMSTNTVDIFLAGKKEPFVLYWDRFQEALKNPEVVESLKRRGFDDEIRLLSLLWSGDTKARLLAEGDINTDLKPILEYRAPYGLNVNSLPENYKMLLGVQDEYSEILPIEGIPQRELEKLARARQARKYLVEARSKTVEGNIDEAIKLTEKGSLIDKEAPSVRRFLAELYSIKAESLSPKDAVSYYEKAIELRPTYYSFYPKIIASYLAEKKNDGAREIIKEAKKQFPWSGTILMYEGILLGVNEDYSGSEKLLLKAKELEPWNVIILNNLAYLYYQTGRKDKAVEEWRQSLKIKPNQSAIRKMFVMTEKLLRLK